MTSINYMMAQVSVPYIRMSNSLLKVKIFGMSPYLHKFKETILHWKYQLIEARRSII